MFVLSFFPESLYSYDDQYGEAPYDVKYGLNFIADTLINPFRPTKINVFDFLSCT